MHGLKLGVCAVAAAFASAASGQVDIDFGNLTGPFNIGTPMPNPYLEGPFSVVPTVGASGWFQINSGNPTQAIAFSSIAGNTGTIEVTSPGSPAGFRFATIDFNGAGGGPASYTFTGFLTGAEVFTRTGSIANFSWGSFANPNPSAVIDTLRVTLNLNGASSVALDNIAVIPVPSPGAAALLALGLPLLGARRRR